MDQQSKALITFEPVSKTITLGEEFYISMIIANLADGQKILGFHDIVSFDPNILKVEKVAVLSDCFLNPILFKDTSFDNTAGTIELNLARSDTAFPGTGGVVYNITFSAIGKGSTALQHTTADLRDENNLTLEVDTGFCEITVQEEALVDVSITKTASPEPAILNGELIYTLILTNSPSSKIKATGVIVEDKLADGVEFVSFTPPGTYNPDENIVSFHIAELSIGESRELTIVTRPTKAGTVTNNVTVKLKEEDYDKSNNTAKSTSTVVDIGPTVDVSVSKFGSPDSVLAVGDGLVYQIFVSCSPDSKTNATGVTVIDKLPDGLEVLSTNPPGDYDPVKNELKFDLGELKVEEVYREIDIYTKATKAGVITNKVTVSSKETDYDMSNNTAEYTNTVVEEATVDLSVTKTGTPEPVTVGGQLVYTMVVTNSANSKANATGVTVVDELPDGLQVISTDPTGTIDPMVPNQIKFYLGELSIGGSRNITIVATPTKAGTITNYAGVKSNEVDCNTFNNHAEFTSTVEEEATVDVSITKTGGPDPVLVGAELVYAINVINSSSSKVKATNVIVTDRLPDDVEYVSSNPPGTISIPENTIVFDPIELEIGGFSKITIVAKPKKAGIITNKVDVTSKEKDFDPLNNHAEFTSTVEEKSTVDVSITKTAAPEPVLVGGELVYTMVVANSSNSKVKATGVTVQDRLPDDVDFISCNPAGSIFIPENTILFDPVELAIGESKVFTIVAKAKKAGVITNKVKVWSNEEDSDMSNNTAEFKSTVQQEATVDLSITKTAAPEPVVVGHELVYTINVANSLGSKAKATEVTVLDTLPDGLQVISSKPAGDFDPAINIMTFNLGELSIGEGRLITITAKFTKAGSITNNVKVSSKENDSDPSNNTAHFTSTVEEKTVDLSITKTCKPNPAMVDGDLVYTMVVTNSPASKTKATEVTVIDTLPPDVDVIDCNPAGTHYETNNELRFNPVELAIGESRIFTIFTKPRKAGTITNKVTVSSKEKDSNMSNNTAEFTSTVRASSKVGLSLIKSDYPDPVKLGDRLTYGLKVLNNGPDTATGVTIKDILPPEVTFIFGHSEGGTCIEENGTVTCNLGTLTKGQSKKASITVLPKATGVICNNVSLTCNESDINIEDSESTQYTMVLKCIKTKVDSLIDSCSVDFREWLPYEMDDEYPCRITGSDCEFVQLKCDIVRVSKPDLKKDVKAWIKVSGLIAVYFTKIVHGKPERHRSLMNFDSVEVVTLAASVESHLSGESRLSADIVSSYCSSIIRNNKIYCKIYVNALVESHYFEMLYVPYI